MIRIEPLVPFDSTCQMRDESGVPTSSIYMSFRLPLASVTYPNSVGPKSACTHRSPRPGSLISNCTLLTKFSVDKDLVDFLQSGGNCAEALSKEPLVDVDVLQALEVECPEIFGNIRTRNVDVIYRWHPRDALQNSFCRGRDLRGARNKNVRMQRRTWQRLQQCPLSTR